MRLSERQIIDFSDKFLYKLKSAIPSHKGAYELLSSVLCFSNQNFPKKIVDYVYKEIVETSSEVIEEKNGNHPEIVENNRYP